MKNLNTILWVLMLLLAGCKTSTQKEIPEINVLQVKVQAVEMKEYKLPVRAAGMLSTTTEMKLGFKTGGIVKQVNTREGATVKRGEILVVLDLSEINAQVNQASIGL